jgi:hypothetical protein
MDKRFLAGTAAGTVALFFAGFLIYGVLLSGYMAENMDASTMVDPPNWLWLVISTAFSAALYTHIFTKWAGISTWKSGASAAALVGFLVMAGFATGMFSMTTLYTGGLVTVAVDILGGTVMAAIGGAAIGATLGMVSDQGD